MSGQEIKCVVMKNESNILAHFIWISDRNYSKYFQYVDTSGCSRDSRPRDWSRLGAIFLVSVSPNISRDSRDWDQPYILDIYNAKIVFGPNMSWITINCKNELIRRLNRINFSQCIVNLNCFCFHCKYADTSK